MRQSELAEVWVDGKQVSPEVVAQWMGQQGRPRRRATGGRRPGRPLKERHVGDEISSSYNVMLACLL